jgi:hypothetical protein
VKCARNGGEAPTPPPLALVRVSTPDARRQSGNWIEPWKPAINEMRAVYSASPGSSTAACFCRARSATISAER